MVWHGSLWDDCLSNTLLCHQYSLGICSKLFDPPGSAGWTVTLPMKYQSSLSRHGRFSVLGTNLALPALMALRITGRCVQLIHPLFQSTHGYTTVNQG